MRTVPLLLSAAAHRYRPINRCLAASFLALCGSFHWGVATPAQGAGHFEVRPVRVELSHPQDIGSLELGNQGTETLTIQTEVRSWSQEAGHSVYAESEALLVSPPIFTVEPGERQVVRIGLRRQVDQASEQTYRVFFSELPSAHDESSPSATGVDIALRLAIPVFVAPPSLHEPPLEGTLQPLADGQFELSLRNPGNVHVQIRQLDCQGAPRSPTAHGQRVIGYLLPGAERSFRVDEDHPSVTRGQDACPLLADTDRGPREVDLRQEMTAEADDR